MANPVEIRFRPHKAGLGKEGLEFATLKGGYRGFRGILSGYDRDI